MFRTIRMRFASLIAGLMLLVLLIFNVFLYHNLKWHLQKALDGELLASASHLVTTIEYNEKANTYVFNQGHVKNLPQVGDEDLVRLVLPSGHVVDSRGEETVPVPPESFQGQGNFAYYTIPFPEERDEVLDAALFPFSLLEHPSDPSIWRIDQMRLVSLPVVHQNEQVIYLHVGRNLRSIKQLLQEFLLLVGLATPIIFCMMGFGSYWLAGRALQPIERIRQQAARISSQDLSKRLNLNLPDDEVGRLARTFDQMLERLDINFRRQHQFISDVSHELRTPLAIIQGEVDVALEQPRPLDDYVQTLQAVGLETQRMTRLVSNLLLLARSDNAALPPNFTRFDLVDMLTVLVEQLQPQAEAAHVLLTLEVPATLELNGDHDQLLQLFANLLENAFVYAPNSTVRISSSLKPGVVEITVSDNGPGIASEHLPHLFKRFYRVDHALPRTSGGSGLGLAIAQEIALAHGGQITVTSILAQGTSFTVRLPLPSNRQTI
jgi:heavy metal sensor kinase